MLPTLFHIPRELFGWPVFGAGLLLVAWLAISAGMAAWQVRQQGVGPHLLGLGATALVGCAIVLWILPAIMDEHGLPIRGYGVMLVLAIVGGIGLTVWRARRAGFDADVVYSLSFWSFLVGIVGARAMYVVRNWDTFQRVDENGQLVGGVDWGKVINTAEGGLVVYGGLIAGGIALVFFLRKHRLPILKLADVVMPGLLVGMGLGRIGCFFTGCCYGGPCDRPWAVQFPFGSPPHVAQVTAGQTDVLGLVLGAGEHGEALVKQVVPGSPAAQAQFAPGERIVAVWSPVLTLRDTRLERVAKKQPVGSRAKAAQLLIDAAAGDEKVAVQVAGIERPRVMQVAAPLGKSRPVHPTQLYSALDALLLCLFLLAYEPFQRRAGELAAWALTLHPVSRFLLETIRTDDPGVGNLALSSGQLISLLLIPVAIGLWFIVLRQGPPRAVGKLAPA